MTIASFCRDELLASGPLSLDDLVTHAVDAGVTRALNPHSSVMSALRHRQLELLDGRWATPLWLLEGRCLTASSLPYRWNEWSEVDADLGLLGGLVPLADPEPRHGTEAGVPCVAVRNGAVEVTTVPLPDAGTLEVAALATRLSAYPTPAHRYGDRTRPLLRAVAQLMVDDPSTFRTPLPPLSTWVPTLVEQARRCEEEARRSEEWWYEQERRRSREVTLDDCTAVEVQLAAERAGQSIGRWVGDAVDRALAAQRPRAVDEDAVVISLGDRWR